MTDHGAVQMTDEADRSERVAVERDYRNCIVNQFRWHSTSAAASQVGRGSIALDQVFVSLSAIREQPRSSEVLGPEERRILREAHMLGLSRNEIEMQLDALRAQRLRDDANRSDTSSAPTSVEDFLRQVHHASIVLLGEPGSGKSTFLRHLALCAAQQQGPPGVANKLPFWMPLSAFGEALRLQETSLEDYLPIYAQQVICPSNVAPLFRDALQTGRALMLLDGLDEVIHSDTRQKVAAQINAMIQRWQGLGNRFLVTSRIVGYREVQLPPSLPHLILVDLSDSAMAELVNKWCLADPSGPEHVTDAERVLLAKREARTLLDELRTNTVARRLGSTPLFLRLLIRQKRLQGFLPKRRIELYGWSFDVIAATMEFQGCERPMIQVYLSELALWMHQHYASGTAPTADIEQALLAIIEREGMPQRKESIGQGEQPLTGPVQLSRLLMRAFDNADGLWAERGPNAMGFLHLTFQEYLVGYALARRNPLERWRIVSAHLHDPRWQESVILCVAHLDNSPSWEQFTPQFFQQILHAGSDYEELLHRDTLFAATCLEEVLACPEEILSAFYSRLIPLVTSNIPSARTAAWKARLVLARLGCSQAWQTLRETLLDSNRELADMVRALIGAHADRDFLIKLSVPLDTLLPWVAKSKCYENLGDGALRLGRLLTTDASVRKSIHDFLDRDPNACGPPSALVAFAGDPTDLNRLAQDVVHRLQHHDKRVHLPTIVALTGDPYDWTAEHEVLSELITVPSFQQTLLCLLCTTDQPVREAVRYLIWVWDRHASSNPTIEAFLASDEVKKTLLAHLIDPSDPDRWRAAALLGPAARSDDYVRCTLLTIAERATTHLERMGAVIALGAVVRTDPRVRSVLLERVLDPDSSVREQAIRSLAPLLTEADAVFRATAGCLDDLDSDVSCRARYLLVAAAKSHLKLRQALFHHLLGRVDSSAVVLPTTTVEMIAKHLLNSKHADITLLWDFVSELLQSEVEQNVFAQEVFVDLLDDEDYARREVATTSLKQPAQQSIKLRSLLLQCMGDPDPWVFSRMWEVLRPLLIHDNDLQQRLVQTIHGTHRRHRIAAVRALEYLVEAHPWLRSLAIELLTDSDHRIRQAAACALKPCVRSDEGVRSALLDAIGDPSWHVQQAVQKTLAHCLSIDPRVRDVLLNRLTGSDLEQKEMVLRAMEEVIKEDQIAQQLVLSCLQDENAWIRQCALSVGYWMGRANERFGSELIRLLEDEHAELQESAIRAIKFYAHRDDVQSALLRVISDPTALHLRLHALCALLSFPASHSALRRVVSAQWGDADWHGLEAAVTSGPWDCIVTEPAKIFPELRRSLLDRLTARAHGNRVNAVLMLSSLIESDEEVRRAICALLEDDEETVRLCAMEAVGVLVMRDPDIKRFLLHSLSIESSTKSVFKSLKPQVASDASIRDAILPYLFHRNDDIRRAAAHALADVVGTDARIRDALLSMRCESQESDRSVPDYVPSLLAPLLPTDIEVRRAFSTVFNDPSNDYDARYRALWDLCSSGSLAYSPTLLEWLGIRLGSEERTKLIAVIAATAVKEPEVLTAVLNLFSSSKAEVRFGAAEVLLALPGRLPPEARVKLHALIDDMRDDSNWEQRLKCAQHFLNDSDERASARALETIWAALDIFPLQDRVSAEDSAEVRCKAALLLKEFGPVYREERAVTRLLRLLQVDTDPIVRETAHTALLRVLARLPAPASKVSALHE